MKTHLSHRLPAKIAAFCLAVIMLCVTVTSLLGIFAMLDLNVYGRPSSEAKTDVMKNHMYHPCVTIVYNVLNDNYESAQYHAHRFNAEFQVYDVVNKTELWSSAEDFDAAANATSLNFSSYLWRDVDGGVYYYGGDFEGLTRRGEDENGAYVVNVAVGPDFTILDDLSCLNTLIDVLYALSYPIYAILAASLVLFVALMSFLLYGAGRRVGREEVCKSVFTAIPFDLLTAAVAIGGCLLVVLVADSFYYTQVGAWVLFVGAAVICSVAVVAWLYTAAVRVKLGTIWKNTVIWWCCRIVKRVWLFIWHGCKELAGGLPLIWKFVLGMLALAVIEFIFQMACWWESDNLLFWWFVEWIIQGAALMALALMLRRLQKGGQALAVGDLSYQVDTSRMLWDFKKHGEDLNNIALGLNRAVEERLKSERLKTELITNVSHDIKTPLTSIINYSDLICKENCDNEKIREYSAVLLRQSERLKKLIEDLVDASKASTGNVDVNLAPFELDVLLTQAVGEYEQKLADCRLDLIVKRPEKGLRIMADGRHMWRVFDNLMNNICKYALPGTRVYLTVEDKFGQAVISFKNTSRYELDVSSDELMERFVRGDSSRSTEGSGLGLSIARSLTDLQGGRLELTVDGDLFKAVLTFNQI